ncbi:MAG: hypothetical protein JRI68_18365 [Deltaproteobacteria bacterium]|nr:hypothetical protein [Deltaproteobacteria bacterium]
MAQEPQEQPETDDDDDDEGSPLGTLLTGIGCLAFSGYLFYYFTQFEVGEAGARRMWWILATLYNVGGKWPPVALLALIGLATLGLGIKGLMGKKAE